MRRKGEKGKVKKCGFFKSILFPFSLFLFTFAFAGEIDVARQALRDGLWEVARTHAKAAGGEVATRIVLESYSREAKWNEVLAAAADSSDPVVKFFKAAALYKLGRIDEAASAVSSLDITDGKYNGDLLRLKAELYRRGGDCDSALAVLEGAKGDDASKLLSAVILVLRGENERASSLWSEVIASTNASVELKLTAALNLGSAEAIRKYASSVGDLDLRRRSALRLGTLLLADDRTFEEGERTVREAALDSPDTLGARGAFLALADALLVRGRHAEAEGAYRAACETWPEAARDMRVREGIAWAESSLGRHEEALGSFSRALELAQDDESRSSLTVKIADELMALGKTDEATAKYREVIAAYPDSKVAKKVRSLIDIRELEKRGREAFAGYRFAEAQRCFAEVAAKDQSRAEWMAYYTVMCLYGQGRDEDAEKSARKLVASAVDRKVSSKAALWLAKFLFNSNRWKESESLFSTAVELASAKEVVAESLLWSTRAAFAGGDFPRAVAQATALDKEAPDSGFAAEGLLVQGEALIELGRFDEAVLVLERVSGMAAATADVRFRSGMLRADAFFAMGADNPARYDESLAAYRRLLGATTPTPSEQLRLAYKTGRTLEKLKRKEEAVDVLYTKVVLAYREGRLHGIVYDDEARAAFSRAAFLLADDAELRGHDSRAVNILKLVEKSDVPAAEEATRRIARIMKKGTLP